MVNQSNLLTFLEENQDKPELETMTFEDYFKNQFMETNEFLPLPIAKYEQKDLKIPKCTETLPLMQTFITQTFKLMKINIQKLF